MKNLISSGKDLQNKIDGYLKIAQTPTLTGLARYLGYKLNVDSGSSSTRYIEKKYPSIFKNFRKLLKPQEFKVSTPGELKIKVSEYVKSCPVNRPPTLFGLARHLGYMYSSAVRYLEKNKRYAEVLEHFRQKYVKDPCKRPSSEELQKSVNEYLSFHSIIPTIQGFSKYLGYKGDPTTILSSIEHENAENTDIIRRFRQILRERKRGSYISLRPRRRKLLLVENLQKGIDGYLASAPMNPTLKGLAKYMGCSIGRLRRPVRLNPEYAAVITEFKRRTPHAMRRIRMPPEDLQKVIDEYLSECRNKPTLAGLSRKFGKYSSYIHHLSTIPEYKSIIEKFLQIRLERNPIPPDYIGEAFRVAGYRRTGKNDPRSPTMLAFATNVAIATHIKSTTFHLSFTKKIVMPGVVRGKELAEWIGIVAPTAEGLVVAEPGRTVTVNGVDTEMSLKELVTAIGRADYSAIALKPGLQQFAAAMEWTPENNKDSV